MVQVGQTAQTTGLSPEHRSYIRRELVVSLIINAVLSLVFSLLVGLGREAIPLWGAKGMAVDFVPQVLMMMFATSLAVTLLTRKRIKAGQVAPLATDRGGPLARAPRNVLLRAVMFAVLALVVFVPATIGVMALLGVDALPFPAFLVMKVLYGVGVTLLAAPLIIRAALASKV